MTENLTVELETEISLEELRLLERAYEKEIGEQGHVGSETLFNYGWGMIQSSFPDDQRKGIALLKELVSRGEKDVHLDCCYYLAIGYLKLGNLYEAKRWNDELLDIQGSHPQGQALAAVIKQRLTKDGLIGMAIVGGSVAILGGVLTYLLRRR